MIAIIDRRIRALLGGIRLAFRGVLTLVKAAGAVQLVQADGLAGEQLQDNELFQHYGFTSNPAPGTMAIVLPIGGRTAHGIIVATEHGAYRLKNLASGEVALYSQFGQVIKLRADGGIDIHAPAGIDVASGATLRLSGQEVHVHAASVYRFDANGQGQKWDGAGVETWQDDDTVKPHHNHAPPEIS